MIKCQFYSGVYMKKLIFFLFISLIIIPQILSIEKEAKGDILSQNSLTADELLSEADDIFQQRDYRAALEKYEVV